MTEFQTDIGIVLQKAASHGADKIILPELYYTVSKAALRQAAASSKKSGGKRACYFSAEFLMGRMIYNNLYNLGLLDQMRESFSKEGLDPNLFEQIEDAALGNGGLGRLAACFLDSAATMGLPLGGYGIRYKYGLFRQYFEDGFQKETADVWLQCGDPWSVRKENERVRIDFKNESVWAVPYDMAIIGYGGKTVNTLRLWQSEPLEAFDYTRFNQQRYEDAYLARNRAEMISSVLYPNDDTDRGKRLRLRQQYFFSSASLQSILRDYKAEHGEDFSHFAGLYAIQLNDTHPTVAIPELLRLLMSEQHLDFAEAFGVVRSVFAYTNHTVMSEALEKWDASLFCSVIPEVYPYVVMLNNELYRDLMKRGVPVQERAKYAIIDNGIIHMARMAIYATHSTNGVAALHTELLKNVALKEWYQVYPERFSNKTNGITQRRWLGLCNPELSGFITERVGDGWQTDLDKLKGLEKYADDPASLQAFRDIKQIKKRQLADYAGVMENGAALNTDAIFCIQVKRLHEYKRQLLNAFSILDIYFQIKDGTLKDFTPMSFLFGAKAAPGYFRAKGIIKYINELARLVESDPDTHDLLQVLFVQNYNVSYAEKLIPAADISEQISTAGTEASGTGNMKFMLNGAVTLGTYDGANIEIVQKAGEHNNFIFGNRVDDIRALSESYEPKKIYHSNDRIRRVVDSLIDGTLNDRGTGMFRDLYTSLLEGASWHKPDQYYLLADFESYVDAKLAANRKYRDRDAFTRMCLMNTANSGPFSSDRTIREYASEIWGLC